MSLKYTNKPNVKPQDVTKKKRKKVAEAEMTSSDGYMDKIGKNPIDLALLDIDSRISKLNDNKRKFKVIKGGKD